MERQVEEVELKKSSRDNSVEVDGQVDDLRGGNAMKCEAGERIEVSRHKFEGQFESKLAGTYYVIQLVGNVQRYTDLKSEFL